MIKPLIRSELLNINPNYLREFVNFDNKKIVLVELKIFFVHFF